jgi:RNA polymerase sigma-54 factor
MVGDAPVTGLHVSQQPVMAPQQTLRPSPALVAATALLALPSAELEEAVERELDENPALERIEGPGRAAVGIEGVPAAPDPAEALLRDVMPLLARADRPIAAYLVGSLDGHGFLDAGVEEIAAALAVSPQRVRRVLRALQKAAPAGVGARDLRECLLLQLDRLPHHPRRALARRIVDEHLPLLGRGLYGELARVLAVDRAEIIDARDFIRARLDPHPWAEAAAPAPPLVPDVAVRESPDGLVVELLEPARFRLVISPAYERATDAAIRRQVSAARAFADRLEQRWRTMRAVAQLAVDRQSEFVRRGPRHLVPLTRAEVAASLGIHESTVSRAVAGRNVELPSGRIVPLARFFEASGAPCDALAELLANERRPKSDAELADELARLGFVLARRTVAKYRERLGVLPSALR